MYESPTSTALKFHPNSLPSTTVTCEIAATAEELAEAGLQPVVV